MKINLLLISVLLLNVSILKAQNLPPQIQKYIDAHKNQIHTYKGVHDRNNVPVCIADTIKSFKYATPSDSILETFNVLEVSTDINGYSNVGFTINQTTGIINKTSDFNIEFNDLNKEIFSEFIAYNPNGTELFGYKGLIFYNSTTQKIDSTIAFYRNLTTQSWDKERKNDYSYNSNGLVFKNQISNWSVNGWVLTDRTLNSYGANNKLSVQNYATWSGAWLPNLKINFFYLPNDSLSQEIVLNQPSGDSLSKTVYTYGSLNRADYYNWNAFSMDFRSIGYNISDFDAQNRITYFEYFYQSNFGTFAGKNNNFYGGGSTDCLSLEVSSRSDDGTNYDDYKTFYIYNTNSAVNLPQNSLDWSVVPNPNDGDFEITAPQGSTITICNSVGQVVWQIKSLQTKNQVNLPYFSAGLYVVRLQNGQNFEVKKIVVE
jgi:Secretion system C-terminal sorting domain